MADPAASTQWRVLPLAQASRLPWSVYGVPGYEATGVLDDRAAVVLEAGSEEGIFRELQKAGAQRSLISLDGVTDSASSAALSVFWVPTASPTSFTRIEVADRSSGEKPAWHCTIEYRHVTGAQGEPVDVFWLRLPGFLGNDTTTDCEGTFGEDWDTAVLERLLPHDRWWLWWTESPTLKAFSREAARVRRSRTLPDAWPRDEQAVLIGRSFLQNFGAALLPPDPALHVLVFRHGPSSYSEIDPNFVVVLSPRGASPTPAMSPAALQRRLRKATPYEPGFELLGGVADRLLMQWDGDLYLAARREDEPALLASLEAWATTFDVRVERSEPGSPRAR
jgi:hypothetical protein